MSFFDWVRGKSGQPVADPEPPRQVAPGDTPDSNSIFSTHMPLAEHFDRDTVIARTFQKTCPNPVGDALGYTGDDSGLQSLKADITGFGNISDLQLSWYASQGFVGYSACAMLAQHPMIDKACTIPAEDAIRNGWDITINDGKVSDADLIEQIRKRDEYYHINEALIECLRMSKVFGIRVVLFDVRSDDPLYYEKPFNPDGVTPGSYRGISQIDPYWITPELDTDAASNPASRHFYEPTWWRCGAKRYHRSHLFVYIPKPVSDLLKPTYLFGGLALTQQIYERVYAAERTANEAPMLAMTKRMLVLNIDLSKAAAKANSLIERIKTFVSTRDNSGVYVAGKDDTVTQLETSLTDVDTVAMLGYQLVASIADVPATRLLGTSPKGFQSNGTGEDNNYRQHLASLQNHGCMPLLQRHYLLMSLSDMGGQYLITPEFRPTDEPTATELADIRFKNSQSALNYFNAGSVDGADIRKVLISDPASGYNCLDDDDIPTPPQPDVM